MTSYTLAPGPNFTLDPVVPESGVHSPTCSEPVLLTNRCLLARTMLLRNCLIRVPGCVFRCCVLLVSDVLRCCALSNGASSNASLSAFLLILWWLLCHHFRPHDSDARSRRMENNAIQAI